MLSIALMLLGGVAVSYADDAKLSVTSQVGAWNRGDLAEFTALYSEDAIFISPSGLTKGRQAVLERYQKKYSSRKAMGTLALEFLDAREQANSVSLVARWTLTYPDKPAATGLTLLVLQRKGDRWFIVQDASM